MDVFGLASSVEVVPVSSDREFTLCTLIEQAGIVPQQKLRKFLSLNYNVEGEKLSFTRQERGLTIKATTNYKQVGEESFETEITPEKYRDDLARSRMYVKHSHPLIPHSIAGMIMSIVYPTFGIGHGFSTSTVFLPPKNEEDWRKQEIFKHEIARHTIVDRLGAIALLDGRLEGVKVTTKYSGHAHDIAVLSRLYRENQLYRSTG